MNRAAALQRMGSILPGVLNLWSRGSFSVCFCFVLFLFLFCTCSVGESGRGLFYDSNTEAGIGFRAGYLFGRWISEKNLKRTGVRKYEIQK